MNDALPARGFGPGLPPRGAAVSLRLAGESLRVEGWPEQGAVPLARLRRIRHDAGLMLEWDTAAGRCALHVDPKVSPDGTAAGALLGRLKALPASTGAGGGGAATRGWVATLLFVAIGLPLLLLVGFFVWRNEIVDAVVARIPVEQEKQLAAELWRIQSARLRPLEGVAAARVVEELGARLVAAKPSPYTFRFTLVDDATVNAFAMPAGYVVVHRGLLERTRNAEELAGVMAHEIEHVTQRHSLRGMVQGMGLAVIAMLVGGDAGIAAQWAKELAGLQFSRQQESEADAGGYARLLAAGIAPRGMADFFDTLAGEQGQLAESMALISTHPASAERSARLREMLRNAPPLPPLPYDWATVKASLRR